MAKTIRKLAVLAAWTAAAASAAIPDIALTEWARGFDKPVCIVPVHGGSPRCLVVEQPGRIREVPAVGGGTGREVLDVRDRVNFGGEKGLLSVALHPSFERNGRLFANYTTGRNDKELRTRIAEFKAGADGRIDPASEKIVLEFGQPFSNHNGGLVAFGPDGYLYVGNGDGGAANDPHGNGQNLQSLLGKFLRIDVDRREAGKAYAIPGDNPFVGRADARGELYAYGLRNPWRWSFDRSTGQLFAGDVGQNNWEEVDVITKGGNYGWRIMEGFHCTPKVNPECDQKGLVLPILEYSRQDGVSVTGGFVYRGQRYPALQGVYLYADFGSRRIWGLRYENGRVASQRELLVAPQAVSSFGEDRDGELFVVGYDGTIYRVQAK